MRKCDQCPAFSNTTTEPLNAYRCVFPRYTPHALHVDSVGHQWRELPTPPRDGLAHEHPREDTMTDTSTTRVRQTYADRGEGASQPVRTEAEAEDALLASTYSFAAMSEEEKRSDLDGMPIGRATRLLTDTAAARKILRERIARLDEAEAVTRDHLASAARHGQEAAMSPETLERIAAGLKTPTYGPFYDGGGGTGRASAG